MHNSLSRQLYARHKKKGKYWALVISVMYVLLQTVNSYLVLNSSVWRNGASKDVCCPIPSAYMNKIKNSTTSLCLCKEDKKVWERFKRYSSTTNIYNVLLFSLFSLKMCVYEHWKLKYHSVIILTFTDYSHTQHLRF